jgi:hypothetical protein
VALTLLLPPAALALASVEAEVPLPAERLPAVLGGWEGDAEMERVGVRVMLVMLQAEALRVAPSARKGEAREVAEPSPPPPRPGVAVCVPEALVVAEGRLVMLPEPPPVVAVTPTLPVAVPVENTEGMTPEEVLGGGEAVLPVAMTEPVGADVREDARVAISAGLGVALPESVGGMEAERGWQG